MATSIRDKWIPIKRLQTLIEINHPKHLDKAIASAEPALYHHLAWHGRNKDRDFIVNKPDLSLGAQHALAT